MKFSTLALFTGLVVTSAQELPAGVAQFNIHGKRSRDPVNPRYKNSARYGSLFKRDDDTLVADLDNKFTHYSIEIDIGGQKQNVIIDTGSSDLWVIDKDNPYCAKTNKEKQLAEMGEKYIICDGQDSTTFDHKKSKSFKSTDEDFYITYGDYSFAEGVFGTDNIKIGDETVKDATFAVAEKTNSSSGVFGIGYKNFESVVVSNGGRFDLSNAYDNIPVLLKKQGITKSVSYSLWLNDPDSKEGNILFGGVDHKKYKGDLQKVPIVNNIRGIDVPLELTIILSSLSIRPDTSSKKTVNIMSNNIPALLDSGTTATLLPFSIIEAVAESLGAEYSPEVAAYLQECPSDDDKSSFEFDFSGIKIQVPFSDMILPVRSTDGEKLKFRNGKTACQLVMQPASDTIILGDSFLRSAYVVYDLENNEVALAPVNFNQKDTKIDVIDSDIPSAKKAPNYSSTKFANSLSINTDISFTVPASGSKPTDGGLKETTDLPNGGGILPTGVQGSGSPKSTSSSSSTTSSSSKSNSAGFIVIPVSFLALIFAFSAVFVI